MQTYWIEIRSSSKGSGSDRDDVSVDTVATEDEEAAFDHRIERLAEYNAEVLLGFLKQIIARRRSTSSSPISTTADSDKNTQPIDEVVEIIPLPDFDSTYSPLNEDADNVILDKAITRQLRGFVSAIAAMYNKNPFHGFEHASHVTMSVTKLLSRIVGSSRDSDKIEAAKDQHDRSYGIASDPLAQFAVVLSALVHGTCRCSYFAVGFSSN